MSKEEIRYKEILKFLKEKGDYVNQSQHIPLFAVVSHIEDWDDMRASQFKQDEQSDAVKCTFFSSETTLDICKYCGKKSWEH